MIKSYGVFAEFYDVLTANIDYKKRALYFDELIKRHDGKQGGLLLDLACGTGSLSEELDNLGYDIIAVDNSPEMLGIAMNKKIEHQKNIQYVCQDMRELDLFGNADITVCALDSLNHLKNFKDLCVVFRKVFMFTEPGGLFLFDINTEYKEANGISTSIESFLRYSESFQETAYPLGDVESALIDTGFEILGIYDDDSFEPVRLNSERAVFAVRKGV